MDTPRGAYRARCGPWKASRLYLRPAILRCLNTTPSHRKFCVLHRPMVVAPHAVDGACNARRVVECLVNTCRLEELRGGSASASWDKWQQRAGTGIAIAVRQHDTTPASKAVQHGCRGRRNTAIGSCGAITGQAHLTSAGPSAAKRQCCRSGDIAWRMQAAELQAEKAASPESFAEGTGRIQT
jgi:hypothetical protein